MAQFLIDDMLMRACPIKHVPTVHYCSYRDDVVCPYCTHYSVDGVFCPSLPLRGFLPGDRGTRDLRPPPPRRPPVPPRGETASWSRPSPRACSSERGDVPRVLWVAPRVLWVFGEVLRVL